MVLGDQVIYDNGWKVRDLRALRRDQIGFVLQAPYLIPFLDVTDNVALPPMLAGVPNAVARARVLDLLTALDVQHHARAMPSQLAGGEQQRVAIARGLVNRPPVILADEPTAPLDSERALAVMRILYDMARQFPTAIIALARYETCFPAARTHPRHPRWPARDRRSSEPGARWNMWQEEGVRTPRLDQVQPCAELGLGAPGNPEPQLGALRNAAGQGTSGRPADLTGVQGHHVGVQNSSCFPAPDRSARRRA